MNSRTIVKEDIFRCVLLESWIMQTASEAEAISWTQVGREDTATLLNKVYQIQSCFKTMLFTTIWAIEILEMIGETIKSWKKPAMMS